MDRPDLEALIDEVLTDAYSDDEAMDAWFTVLVDELAVPFETVVLGVPVTVTRLELPDVGGVCAVCVRGRHRARLPLAELALPDPPPAGAEWVTAWRQWSTGA